MDGGLVAIVRLPAFASKVIRMMPIRGAALSKLWAAKQQREFKMLKKHGFSSYLLSLFNALAGRGNCNEHWSFT